MTRFIAAGAVGAALILATADSARAQSYYNPYTGTSVNNVTAYNPYLRGYTGYSTGYNFNTNAAYTGVGYSGLYGSSFNRTYSNPLYGVGGYQTGFSNPVYSGFQSGYSTPFSTGYRAGYSNAFGGGYRYGYGARRW